MEHFDADKLEQARRLAARDAEEAELRASRPIWEAEEAQEQREALAEGRLNGARQAARLQAEISQPTITEWRQEFAAWVNAGWALIERLDRAERPLFDAMATLAALAAGARNAANRVAPGDYEQEVRLESSVDRAVTAELAAVGGASGDLWPLPAGGIKWAEDMKQMILRHARQRVYNPAAGGKQFKRGGLNLR